MAKYLEVFKATESLVDLAAVVVDVLRHSTSKEYNLPQVANALEAKIIELEGNNAG